MQMQKFKDFIVDLWEGFRDSGCLGSLIFSVGGILLVLFFSHSCSKQEEKKYDKVYQSAYEEGYNDGHRDGEIDGKWFGYYDGYEKGYDDADHNRKYDDDPPY